MRVTRRSLKATNTQLAAQLAVHQNVTRRQLQETVSLTRAVNKQLTEKLSQSEKSLLEAFERIAKLSTPVEQPEQQPA